MPAAPTTTDLIVSTAIGRGRNQRSAFDRALSAVGAADFNLVRVGSVVPPATRIVAARRWPCSPSRRWGDRLYAVYAAGHGRRPGQQVWAGIGWVQDADTGMGLFVEQTGRNERSVRAQVLGALEDAQRVRGLRLGRPQLRVAGGVCNGTPTCALVIGFLGSEPWPSTAVPDGPMLRAS